VRCAHRLGYGELGTVQTLPDPRLDESVSAPPDFIGMYVFYAFLHAAPVTSLGERLKRLTPDLIEVGLPDRPHVFEPLQVAAPLVTASSFMTPIISSRSRAFPRLPLGTRFRVALLPHGRNLKPVGRRVNGCPCSASRSTSYSPSSLSSYCLIANRPRGGLDAAPPEASLLPGRPLPTRRLVASDRKLGVRDTEARRVPSLRCGCHA